MSRPIFKVLATIQDSISVSLTHSSLAFSTEQACRIRTTPRKGVGQRSIAGEPADSIMRWAAYFLQFFYSRNESHCALTSAEGSLNG
jgi:hypothetical protein